MDLDLPPLTTTLAPSLLALPLGFALGLVYFTGLWFTVRRLPSSRHPVLLIVGSGVLRLGLAVAVLAVLVQGHGERLLVALVGVLVARTLLIALWGPQEPLDDLILED
jgi:F1F0 ATPase subunit 2